MDEDRRRLIKFVKENTLYVIIGIIIVGSILFYFIAIYKRVPRYLSRIEKYERLVEIQPLQYNRQVMKNDFRLCDFYVASSYKSYLPCTNYYDYSSCEVIKKVLFYGARRADLDVFNKSFHPCTSLSGL